MFIAWGSKHACLAHAIMDVWILLNFKPKVNVTMAIAANAHYFLNK
jgi:hypothetical protein